MEYVDGPTLREMIGPRPLPPKRVLDLAAQLAEGLAKAHEAGIVHRDLKPENVMVSRDGVVKIVDFGLSKPAAAVVSPAGAAASDAETSAGELRTQSGTIVGTVGYMAPEQARGEAADHRADQFALGAIVYEMATGRRAFHRDSAVQTLADIIDRDPDPIEATNPGVPGAGALGHRAVPRQGPGGPVRLDARPRGRAPDDSRAFERDHGVGRIQPA